MPEQDAGDSTIEATGAIEILVNMNSREILLRFYCDDPQIIFDQILTLAKVKAMRSMLDDAIMSLEAVRH